VAGVEDLQDSADVEQLRSDLRALHVEWDETAPRPGSREYLDLLTAIKDATYAVIDAERQQRELTVESTRQRKAGLVRVVASLAVGAWIGAAVSSAGGWVSRWWLVPIALFAAVSLRGWAAEPDEPAAGQGDRLRGALVVAASGAVTLGAWMLDQPQWQPMVATAAGLGGVWSWAAGLAGGLTGSRGPRGPRGLRASGDSPGSRTSQASRGSRRSRGVSQGVQSSRTSATGPGRVTRR